MRSKINSIIIYSATFNSIRMLIGASSAVFLVSKGFNFTSIAELKIFQAFLLLILDIPTGYISDKISKKWSLVFSVFCGAIWLLLTGLSTRRIDYFIAEGFNALSLALAGGAFEALLVNRANHENSHVSISKIFGKSEQYHFVGMTLAALVGGLAVNLGNKLWITAGGLLLLQFLFLGFLLPSDTEKISFRKLRILHSLKEDLIVIRKLYKGKYLFLFLASVSVFLFYQVIIQYWQLIVNLVELVKLNEFLLGPIFASILLVQAGSGFVLKKFGDSSNVLSIGFLGLSISSACSYFFSNSIFAVMLLLTSFFNLKLISSCLNVKMNQIAPNTYRATLLSINSSVLRLSLIFALPLCGRLFESSGLKNTHIFGIACVVVSLGVLFFARATSKIFTSKKF
jgi:MFS family permease